LSFAEQLARVRKLRHFSQQQLAMRSGISQQAIRNLETGKRCPSDYTIRQLAAALRVPMSALLEEEQTKTPTAEGDGLMEDIINRIQQLSDPALDRLSDFLDGLEAGQEIALPSPAAPDP
jgi:transcriptional regulator with XRE-family HTH domain